jgi:hypothetical protein
MHTSEKFPVRRFGGGRAMLLLVLLLLVVGGTLAYRYLFQRPGEAAIQLLPADSLVVVTLDTTPSEQQAAVFRRISDAIRREGLDTQVDRLLADSLEKAPVSEKIRPYVKHSFAFAMWNTGGSRSMQTQAGAALLALSDPGRVRDVLAQYGRKQTANGLDVYTFQNGSLCAAIISDYLALSDRPASLARIEAVRAGQPSVAKLAEYQAARAALPEDANLMIFVSPAALEEIGKESRSLGVNPLRSTKWMAIGATVRDDGIAFDYRYPMDAAAFPPLRVLGEIGPLDTSLLKRLPAGAYGVMAWSQPAKYWDYVRDSVRSDAHAVKSFDEGIAEFEKQTGMSVPNDILPALSGHLVLAVYPDASGTKSGVDGLIVVDDASGANPAALAAKLRAYVERASSEGGKPGVRFASTEKGGATVWAIDPESEKALQHSMGEMAGSAMPGAGGPPGIPSPPPGQPGVAPSPPPPPILGEGPGVGAGADMTGRPAMPPVTGSGAPHRELNPPVAPEVQNAVKGKTVVYAQVGNTVLIASSHAMLDAAVTAWSGEGRPLAEDPAYVRMQAQMTQNAQNALMVNLPAIMEALRPTLEKAMKDSGAGITADDIIKMFGAANTGLVGSGRCDGKVGTGTLFMPLDFDRVIHMIGVATRQGGPGAGSRPPVNASGI